MGKDMGKEDYIDTLLEKEIEKGKIPGAHVGIYSSTETIYEKTYGGYKEDYIYRMYSMTKPVAAVAAMLLYERGQLELWAPVSDYLPEFENVKVLKGEKLKTPENPVRIAHLLNMTSGIVYPDTDEPGLQMARVLNNLEKQMYTEAAWTTREAVLEMSRVPLAFEPGERFRYGLSADVLGALIEIIDGRELGCFFREEIFDKLGMSDTGFHVSPEKQNRLAVLYRQEKQNGRIVLKERNTPHLGVGNSPRPPRYISAGAGLYSTMSDYLKFTRMLLSKGKYPGGILLSPITITYFLKNQLTEHQCQTMGFDHLQGYGYGSLMRIHQNPFLSGSSSAPGEYGWDACTGPYFSISPAQNQIFLYLTQLFDTPNWPLIRSLKSIANTL